MKRRLLAVVVLFLLGGCGESANQPPESGEQMTREQEDAYVAETLAADARPEDPR